MKRYAWENEDIVHAIYSNPDKDTLMILYRDANRVMREYVMPIDEEHQEFRDFMDLINWNWEGIEIDTRTHNMAQGEEFVEAFLDYAQRHGYVQADKIASDVRMHQLIFEFDSEKEEDINDLFEMKLQIFDRPEVLNSKSKVNKTKLRKADTVLELLAAYSKFVK